MYPSLDELLHYVARSTPPAPALLGDPDLELSDLVHVLSDLYGRPRTLYLDGEADPTVDDRTGAPLLDLLDGMEAEVLRAWSYGRRWIGAGTEGGRVFVAVAQRVTPTDRYDPTAPEASYVERVVELTGWTMDRTHPVDWVEWETRIETPLPSDYKQLVEIFGAGQFDDWISLDVPHPTAVYPHVHFLSVHAPEPHGDRPQVHFHNTLAQARAACAEQPGKVLLSWAGCEHGSFYWHMNDPDPDRWPVLATEDDFTEWDPLGDSASECLHRLLTDPRVPFSLARHFDRHWFS